MPLMFITSPVGENRGYIARYIALTISSYLAARVYIGIPDIIS
jgi:hypothetical protein